MARKKIKEEIKPTPELSGGFDESPISEEELEKLSRETSVEETEEETEEEETVEEIEKEVITKTEVKTEEAAETSGEPFVMFRKEGGGCLRIAGKLIKPGQVFPAQLSTISKAFLPSLTRIDGGSMEVVTPVVKKEPAFKLIPASVEGKFLIVNIRTKKPLSTLEFGEKEAREMLTGLNS